MTIQIAKPYIEEAARLYATSDGAVQYLGAVAGSQLFKETLNKYGYVNYVRQGEKIVTFKVCLYPNAINPKVTVSRDQVDFSDKIVLLKQLNYNQFEVMGEVDGDDLCDLPTYNNDVYWLHLNHKLRPVSF